MRILIIMLCLVMLVGCGAAREKKARMASYRANCVAAGVEPADMDACIKYVRRETIRAEINANWNKYQLQRLRSEQHFRSIYGY